MSREPDPDDGHVDSLLADLPDQTGLDRPGWRRRLLRGMTIGEALAKDVDHRMIAFPAPVKVAGLISRRIADLGVSRSEYLRRLVAADLSQAYEVPYQDLMAPPRHPNRGREWRTVTGDG